MKLSRLLNKRGSALVWALCAMMVLTIAVAGILTLSLAYYNRALDEVSAKKAELLAQSGIEYARLRLESGSEYGDYATESGKWKIRVEENDGRLVVYYNHKDGSNTPISVELTEDGTDTDIAIYVSEAVRDSEDEDRIIIKLTSVAQCGRQSARCAAIFYGNGDEDLWTFYGYTES